VISVISVPEIISVIITIPFHAKLFQFQLVSVPEFFSVPVIVPVSKKFQF